MKMRKLLGWLCLSFFLAAWSACGGSDDEPGAGSNGSDDGSGTAPEKFGVTFSSIEHDGKAICMTVKVTNPDNLTGLKAGYECSFVKDFSDWARSEKELDENNCAKLRQPVSHMVIQYYRPYVTSPSLGRVYGKVWTYNGMSWEITPPRGESDFPSGGSGETPSGPTPANVNSFSITPSSVQQLLNSTYMGNNKWRLLIRTFTQVTYTWSCNDKSVAGIVVVINSPKTPVNGVKYNGPDAQFFNRSGTYQIKQWPRTGGYYNFYIRTYTSDYRYSSDWEERRVYIEGAKNSYITSSKPGL